MTLQATISYYQNVKVLVVGQGGREHALVRALKLSPSVREVHCMPGSAGISHDALCHQWDGLKQEEVYNLVKKLSIDLVVVGPDQFIADGLAETLRSQGILAVGPNKIEAQLESSKIYAKKFMQKAGIPTAKFEIVNSVESSLEVAKKFMPPYVLKADGLAAGKGVIICKDLAELEEAAARVFIKKEFGSAGENAFLEEFSSGWELSYLVLTNGESYESLPLSQDHKKLLDNDLGPNTGGMGTVAPIAITQELKQEIKNKILDPIMLQMKKEKFFYRGILYVGMMISKEGPIVLEFNARFGDPEAQVILPLLDGDWGQVFLELAKGNLCKLKWKPLSSACVVLAAEGYPASPKKGVTIIGDVFYESSASYFLHAGTLKAIDGKWQTNGGRVLNSIGIGTGLKDAIAKAYVQAQQVRWAGLQFRKDIGKNFL